MKEVPVSMNDMDRQRLYDFCQNRAKGASDRHDWINIPETRGLCGSCNSSMILSRHSRNKVTIICTALPGMTEVPDDITRCSNYSDRAAVSLRTMVETATLIDIGRTGEVGFQLTSPNDPTAPNGEGPVK